jgi:hypothetical protein
MESLGAQGRHELAIRSHGPAAPFVAGELPDLGVQEPARLPARVWQTGDLFFA